jgi:hypothetical protein
MGVNYHHGKGLHPTQNSDGEWFYDRAEVERLAAKLRVNRRKKPGPRPKGPGDLAREVFRMFDLACPFADIVQALSVEPELVLRWHGLYLAGFDRPPSGLTPEQQIARDKLALAEEIAKGKLAIENARVELARDKTHLAAQRKRGG